MEGFPLTQAITGPKAGANVYGIRDVLSTTRGRHSLYFGGEAGLEKDFQLTSLNNYGTFTFAQRTEPTGARVRPTVCRIFSPAFRPAWNQDTGLYANANWYTYGLFAQDDWRIRPNLTLNLGLRYDWQQAPTDPQTHADELHARRTVSRISEREHRRQDRSAAGSYRHALPGRSWGAYRRCHSRQTTTSRLA